MYTQILFAVKFGNSINPVVKKKIKTIRGKFNSTLSLIHIVEMPTVDPIPEIVRAEPLYIRQAQNQLADVGILLDVSVENQHIEIGDPKTIILEFAKKHHIDLLIVGHHERQGLYNIVGSTVCALISHAKCDVWTIPYSVEKIS